MLNVKTRSVIGAAFWGLSVAAASSATAQAVPKPAVQAAPMPARLADGKPNWTGFWTPIGGLLDRNFGPGFKPKAPGAPNPARAPETPRELLKAPYKARLSMTMRPFACLLVCPE
jgi:hypothetical protein